MRQNRLYKDLDFPLPQKPESSPTAKQLLSWLNVTDKETGPSDSSITGRVFMVDFFVAVRKWIVEEI